MLYGDDQGWIFTFPFPPSIPRFVLGITQTHTAKQSSKRKTVPQKNRQQLMKNEKNKNSKNIIHNTLQIRQKYFYSNSSKCYVSYGGIEQHCKIQVRGTLFHRKRNHSHTHLRSRCFPFSNCSLSWNSREIPISWGNPVPMVISNAVWSMIRLLQLLTVMCAYRLLSGFASFFLTWNNVHSLGFVFFACFYIFCVCFAFYGLGCQYQCHSLPGNSRLWNDLLLTVLA